MFALTDIDVHDPNLKAESKIIVDFLLLNLYCRLLLSTFIFLIYQSNPFVTHFRLSFILNSIRSNREELFQCIFFFINILFFLIKKIYVNDFFSIGTFIDFNEIFMGIFDIPYKSCQTIEIQGRYL